MLLARYAAKSAIRESLLLEKYKYHMSMLVDSFTRIERKKEGKRERSRDLEQGVESIVDGLLLVW